jgi:hypothetical protein
VSHPLLITLLADGPKNTGPDFGKASPVGLFVIVLLLIGVFALVWSMNRHLKRVPASFDSQAAAEPAADVKADGKAAQDGDAPAEEPSGDPSG